MRIPVTKNVALFEFFYPGGRFGLFKWTVGAGYTVHHMVGRSTTHEEFTTFEAASAYLSGCIANEFARHRKEQA